MAREKEDYRANLEILNSRFPDHDMLTFSEIGKSIVNERVCKPALARYMCG